LRASGSDEAAQPSSAFSQLHEGVRRWIYDRGWRELRDLQELAIPPILAGAEDVILSAATASGKTEAAFFPICSRIAGETRQGICALYVGPLKALINDQWRRLDDLCERLEIPVNRWHGDVASNKKRAFLDDPRGVLLITPESLEALFVIHGPRIGRMFGALSYVVVDELHAFIGAERGRQLQSLLHRLEIAVGRRVPRIALSATLGDMSLAAGFLRPGGGDQVRLLSSSDSSTEILLQVRGYLTKAPTDGGDLDEHEPGEDVHGIAQHLFKTLRGTDNLVFTNRRAEVERYADLLARRCERERVPNEFFAHHGSLSKELREDVEARLKKEKLGPVNVVCTNTLEMGIDIESVRSVAQLGAPFSVASTRQRLGRSGRRQGEPAILRVYIQEEEITSRTAPQDSIRAELVQAVAILELLLRTWCEPPARGALHLSTLVQQVLSLIAQHGGVTPLNAFRILCASGPFNDVSQQMFTALLRGLGKKNLIVQSSDGTLLLGDVGERLVNHYSFFSAFKTPEEYRLVAGGRNLGTLPIHEPLMEGMFLLFAGQRWRVVSVDPLQKVVDLVPGPAGRVPRFGGTGGQVHDLVRREMLAIYTSFDVPRYLDARASALLVEARMSFVRLGLLDHPFLRCGNDTVFFPWIGDRVMSTLALELTASGLEVSRDGVALTLLHVSPDQVQATLERLAARGTGDANELARKVKDKAIEKYDGYLPEDLLSAGYASSMLDMEGAQRALTRTVERAMLSPVP
jgi:ATP-dependent helicase Lhr and Lhr-like helicase